MFPSLVGLMGMDMYTYCLTNILKVIFEINILVIIIWIEKKVRKFSMRKTLGD